MDETTQPEPAEGARDEGERDREDMGKSATAPAEGDEAANPPQPGSPK